MRYVFLFSFFKIHFILFFKIFLISDENSEYSFHQIKNYCFDKKKDFALCTQSCFRFTVYIGGCCKESDVFIPAVVAEPFLHVDELCYDLTG